MHYLHKSRLPIQDETKKSVLLSSRNWLISNKMNKKDYKSFQLVASEKQNNLETAAEEVA